MEISFKKSLELKIEGFILDLKNFSNSTTESMYKQKSLLTQEKLNVFREYYVSSYGRNEYNRILNKYKGVYK